MINVAAIRAAAAASAGNVVALGKDQPEQLLEEVAHHEEMTMKELLKMLAREVVVPLAIAAATKVAEKKLAAKTKPVS